MLQKIRRLFADPPQTAETCQPPNTTPEQIIERLEREAAEGNVDAMFRLGSIYFSGEGVKRDPAVANQRFARKAKPCSA
ncbi:MAG: hypothetical protein PHV81_06090, partial [Candidatus Methanomethylophilaceae archaeon]|nr:hypothetical protein [Candidatus Methanomethylophilaceae archaeon]